ncbi:MAG: hypothetical protein ABI875_01015 [Gemmatimonadales bacterium]
MRYLRTTILAAVVALPCSAASLHAQIKERPRVFLQKPSRFTIGGGLLLSQPKGDLANNIDNGFGADFYGLFKVDRDGVLSLRVDLGGAQYGSETLPAAYVFGPRTGFEVQTSNSIYWAGIGPQIMAPAGPVRPYGNVSIGVMDFTTRSSVRGTGNLQGETFASTENQSDATRTWIFGGGLYIPLTGSMSLMSIDIGARYFTGGEASYLRKGAIRDNPDGTIDITPSHSKTDQVTWHLGLSYTIPRTIRR